jgi:hypothetical protein
MCTRTVQGGGGKFARAGGGGGKMDLNQEQDKAAHHPAREPLMILAGKNSQS